MRPASLDPLFAEAASLKGIGKRTAQTLARLAPPPTLPGTDKAGAARIIDLLLLWPHRIIDRGNRPAIGDIVPGTLVTLEVTIAANPPVARGASRRPHKITVFDDTGELDLVFFHGQGRYLHKLAPEGSIRMVSGQADEFSGRLQIVHPDYVLSAEEFAALPAIEPVYPLTYGISNRMVLKAMAGALERLPVLPEWLDPAFVKSRGWNTFSASLARVHRPESLTDLNPAGPARARLAMDEIMANQLALALLRRARRATLGRALTPIGARPADLADKLRAALAFPLTSGQNAAIDEIVADMGRDEQMVRLLQGDVGAGKTVVALMAMAAAIEAGTQAALMAPTEILARQHYQTLAPLLAGVGRRAALLTAREKGKTREALLADLASGKINVLIGTHALFQADVEFHDLGLAVIDEQHRFGVHQRLALQAKSTRGAADLLVMTATPIPRTLLLTHYGNMDVSRLTERPPGRGKIETRAISLDRIDTLVARLEKAVDKGARVYWICPLIDDEGDDEKAAAEARARALKPIFGDRVALVHGRMTPADKDAAMAAFKEGKVSVLVATTVVEVGVDVPEATIMVIERAERFGLAQLHQLRGRVGRSERESSCVLLYKAPLSDDATARLDICRQTDDGFRIADEDLALRGGGEVFGTRQSGIPGFRLADPIAHVEMIETAKAAADAALAQDPTLTGPHKELKTLLYLFERDEAIRLAGSG